MGLWHIKDTEEKYVNYKFLSTSYTDTFNKSLNIQVSDSYP